MSGFAQTVRKFKVNETTPFSLGGPENAQVAMKQIHAFGTLLAMAHRVDMKGDCVMNAVNPELVAEAFEGIASLAAFALLNLDDGE